MSDKDNHTEGEVYIEYTQAGNQMRIAAIDASSGVEVVAIAPLNATQQQMQQLALGKLRRRMLKLGKA